MHTGSCLCGAVRFEVSCPLPGPDACHCTTCRRWTGHVLVSTDLPRAAVTIHGAENVSWFASSQKVRRGFCATCGSTLFWDPIHRDVLAIAMGAFDLPTNTRLAINVNVAEKGDYYDLEEGVPQR